MHKMPKLRGGCRGPFGRCDGGVSQWACTPYSVKDGDTLGEITTAADRTTDGQQVFIANRDIIAASPNVLAPGTPLILPCLDGPLRPEAELSSITPSGLSACPCQGLSVVPEMATMIGL